MQPLRPAGYIRGLPVLLLIFMLNACQSAQSKKHKEDAFHELAFKLSQVSKRLSKGTVAVFSFDIPGEKDHSYADYVAEKLTHELVNTGKLSVLERSRLKKVLREQSLGQSGFIDSSTAAKIGKILSVEGVITGTIHRYNGKVEILARVISSETALILRSVAVQFPDNNSTNRIGRKESDDFNLKISNNSGSEQSTRIDNNQPSKNWNSQISGNTGSKSADSTVFIPQEAVPSAKISSVNVVVHRRAMYISGLISNTGQVPIKSGSISFAFYNRKGEQIEVVNAYMDRYVDKGETLPFSGFQNPAVKYASYKIIYKPEKEEYFTNVTRFKSSRERFRKDRFLGYRLSGIVKNLHRFSVTYPKIIVSLYDRKGKFIGKAYGFATLKKLQPGQSSPYSVMIYDYGLAGKPTRYRLNFSGLQAGPSD